MSNYTLHCGDALTVLRTMPSNSVNCAITSPPYFGLRAYLPDGHPDKAAELGGEETPEQYVAKLVEVFREVRRILHPSGVLWLNIGDTYASSTKGSGGGVESSTLGPKSGGHGMSHEAHIKSIERQQHQVTRIDLDASGLKPKDLIGIPWLLAFALRADGWWLRQEIIWAKTAPMPESVTDRCTKAHEQVFLLAKSRDYFFDAEAIKEPISRIWGENNMGENNGWVTGIKTGKVLGRKENPNGGLANSLPNADGTRNKRSVWTLGPEPFSGSHYAVMPTKLVEPCLLSGTSAKGCCSKCLAPWERVVEREPDNTGYVNGPGGRNKVDASRNDAKGCSTSTLATIARYNTSTLGWQPTCQCQADVIPCTVLDCFFGSGTVLAVALKHGRRAIGIDLDARNIELAERRIQQSQPMLLEVT